MLGAWLGVKDACGWFRSVSGRLVITQLRARNNYYALYDEFGNHGSSYANLGTHHIKVQL